MRKILIVFLVSILLLTCTAALAYHRPITKRVDGDPDEYQSRRTHNESGCTGLPSGGDKGSLGRTRRVDQRSLIIPGAYAGQRALIDPGACSRQETFAGQRVLTDRGDRRRESGRRGLGHLLWEKLILGKTTNR